MRLFFSILFMLQKMENLNYGPIAICQWHQNVCHGKNEINLINNKFSNKNFFHNLTWERQSKNCTVQLMLLHVAISSHVLRSTQFR